MTNMSTRNAFSFLSGSILLIQTTYSYNIVFMVTNYVLPVRIINTGKIQTTLIVSINIPK